MKNFKRLNEILMADIKGFLLSWLPDGKFEGPEFVALNPTRPDSGHGSFKFNVEKGLWADYSCGDGSNDAISYFAYINGIKPGEAYDRLLEDIGGNIDGEHKVKKSVKKEETLIDYESEPKPFRSHNADHIYNYNGRFIVLRYDATDERKKKKFEQYTWTAKGWKSSAPSRDRPLFGIQEVQKLKTILLVEGEKCVLALRSVGIPAVCWSGGSNAIDKTDWADLMPFSLICWPDNDDPGFKAMHSIITKLGKEEQAKIIKINTDTQKYDAADFIADGNGQKEIVELIKAAIPFNSFYADPNEEPPPEEPEGEDDGAFYSDDYEEPNGVEKPWIALGYNKGTYYYYSKLTKQIIDLNPAQHVESSLLQFAELNFWREYFQGSKKIPIDWGRAREFLMHESIRAGVFDPNRIRGLGCWCDNNEIIVHLGNCIAVGKRKIPLAQFESKFVYEAGLKIDEDFDIQPAAIEEAKQLADICNEFSWKNNMHGSYLAGWIVDAIIGGSLKWRPHMFLTAGSGKGKSTVMNFIIKPILGSFCNKFIGPTSEAGFRQKNGSSSLAIFCDEFEGENDKQRAEIDKIFMLLRTASSQTDATITKGGKDGTPKSYALNGCCIMSGINVNLVKRADVTRHTVVTLDGKLSQEDFDKLNKCIVETVTPQYGAAIRARIIGMAHTIRANHDTFSKACAIRLGARLGDQIGALMAGYYALHSDKMITYDAAYKWVLEQDWSEYDEVQNQADEVDFMDYLVGLQVFCDSGKRRSIAELINIVGSSVSEYDTDNTESVDKKEAKNALGRYGLAVSAGRGDVPEGWIAVACKHPELAKLLSGTPWAVGWKHQLMRIEGVKTVKSWGFAGKITSCLVVPNIFTKQNSI